MRRFAAAAALGLIAASAAATPAEHLTFHGLSARGTGGSLRASFPAPLDDASRDLRTAAVSVRIGEEPAQTFAKGTRGYRVHRRGTRARFSAPRRPTGPLKSFRLFPAAGSFDASWRGVRVDFAAPPVVELVVGSHVYRGGGPDDDPDPTPAPSLPDGPASFSSLHRGTAVLPPGTTALADVRLRSPSELASYLSKFQSPPALPAIDFAATDVAVVAGTPFEMPLWPWAVEVTGVAASAGSVTVTYDAFFGPMSGPVVRAPGPLPTTVFVQAVTVPRAAKSVIFDRVPEERPDPWH